MGIGGSLVERKKIRKKNREKTHRAGFYLTNGARSFHPTTTFLAV